jgi:hypothetical protein
MNNKERVNKTFDHKEPDRVPVTELYINSPVASDIIGRTALTGFSGFIRCEVQNQMLIDGRAKEFYTREVEDLVDVYRAMDLATVIIERPPLQDPVLPKVLEENVWKFEDNKGGFWTIVKYCPDTDMYHECDSWILRGGLPAFEEYVIALENDPVDLGKWSFDQARYILDKCGEDMFVMAVVEIDFPPMSFSSWGGVFLEAMAFRPDLVERYLDYRVRKGLKFVDKYADMGVDAVFDGEDLAGDKGPLFSPADYRKYYMPRFQTLIEACHKHGMKYVRHTDGNIMQFADAFLRETGIDAYQSIDPSAGMDISLIKKEYGDKVALIGNVDCASVLHLGTKEDVIRETKKVMKIASPGGGHILSSSNTIHSHVPTENFVAMVDTVKEYGKYPINIDI